LNIGSSHASDKSLSRRLLENINEVMKEEYEQTDRHSLNKTLNMIQPMYPILSIAYIVLFYVIFIGAGFNLNPNRLVLQAVIAIFIITIFAVVLSFILLFTEWILLKKKMQKRLILKLDSLVKEWNFSYEEDGIFAVHEPMWENGRRLKELKI
jgi:hypothetical protein